MSISFPTDAPVVVAAATASREPLTVEVWSDVVCPWCYVGKRRLEAALAQTEEDVRVVWRSFQLDPAAPRPGEPGHGEDLATLLGRKYGGGPEAGQQMSDRMTEVAATEGLPFDLGSARRGNTGDAHRLLHLAAVLEEGQGTQVARRGLQDALKERLLRGYFTEAEDVSLPQTLLRLATDAGLPAEQVADVLAGEAFAADVVADQAQAQAYGASGVPFTVIDGRYGVSGAQPVEVFADALRRARADRGPALVEVSGVSATADQPPVCGPGGCAPTER